MRRLQTRDIFRFVHVDLAFGKRRQLIFFFFQAEDGIRDYKVTGVQTCALPIYSRDLLNIEGRFPGATVKELERRGHTANRWPDFCELAGHAHGITIDPVSGVRTGGADPRSDGAAIGY